MAASELEEWLREIISQPPLVDMPMRYRHIMAKANKDFVRVLKRTDPEVLQLYWQLAVWTRDG